LLYLSGAREGHKVKQFKNLGSDRFVAVAAEGKITAYDGPDEQNPSGGLIRFGQGLGIRMSPMEG